MVLYPNPAKDKVFLGNATIGTPFNILDNTGRNVKSGEIKKELEEIDINGLAPGIYYVDIRQGSLLRNSNFNQTD